MAETAGPADRLESLWEGEFGDAYVERNQARIPQRQEFWSDFLARHPARRVLEVGCAHGENLQHLATLLDPRDVWGIDINRQALARARTGCPDSNLAWGPARELPYRDRHFDLVFTFGLLIHQPDESLPLVMGEIVRCSRRWVVCGEYDSDVPTEVEYRGQQHVLFKRDYGRLYRELFPDLTLVARRELTAADGFDRVTLHVLERMN